MFYLVDDGTLDTVIECSECLTQLRYTYSGEPDADCTLGPNCGCKDRFVDWAFADAKDTHECGVC